MDNLPRQMLRRIVAKYGKDVCSDARRCEALLNDLCGAHRREINVLVNAIEERVPLDLLAAGNSTPHELLLARLEKRFEDQTGLITEAAQWAVETWALALGVVTDTEIEDRKQKRIVEQSRAKTEPVQPSAVENKTTNQSPPTVSRTKTIPLPQSRTPSLPAKNAPPITKPPNSTTNPLPPVFSPSNTQPPVQTPRANPPLQPSTPVVVSKAGFGILRGCLLVIFLLAVASVVLFFGVPYAIEVMRETQRERNNEPPRFPNR